MQESLQLLPLAIPELHGQDSTMTDLNTEDSNIGTHTPGLLVFGIGGRFSRAGLAGAAVRRDDGYPSQTLVYACCTNWVREIS